MQLLLFEKLHYNQGTLNIGTLRYKFNFAATSRAVHVAFISGTSRVADVPENDKARQRNFYISGRTPVLIEACKNL